MTFGPKVSVIIPVYNAEKFLDESLETVANQSLEEIEIICVDDGSTDRSLEILEGFCKKDPRFQLLTQKNQFAGAARNAGVNIASGEYVYFFDCDDLLHEDALNQLYGAALSFDADIVRGKANAFDHETGELIENPYYRLDKVPLEDFNIPLCFEENHGTLLRCPVAPWAGIARRSFLVENDIRFPPLRCVNDRAFYIHSIVAAKKIIIADIVIQDHRRNNSESLVGQRYKSFDCHYYSYKEVVDKISFLPSNLYGVVIDAELRDLAVWFRRAYDTEYWGEIKCSMTGFLEDIGKTVRLDDVSNQSWFKSIQGTLRLDEAAEPFVVTKKNSGSRGSLRAKAKRSLARIFRR